MEPFEKQFHTESREVKLSAAEKAAMRARILAAHPIPSPYTLYMLPVFRGVAISLSLLIVVVGPATYGAQSSGPGDFLYGFETGVIEEVEESLLLTRDAKRKYHAERLEERLDELQQLDDRTLNLVEANAVLAGVVEHAEAAVVDEPGDVSDTERFTRLVRTAALLGAHEEVLEDLQIENRSIEILAEEVEEKLEDRTEEYVRNESGAEVMAEIAERLDRADDALAGIESRNDAEALEGRFDDVREALEGGDLGEALTEVNEIEVELLKEEYLEEVFE